MSFPKHVAIIMDGNGRWAEQRGHGRVWGHIKGAQVAKKIITCAVKNKISFLTLYAFSSENWGRPSQEVSFLMRLLKKYLNRERQTLVKQNIVFKVIGNIAKLPLEAQDEINKTIQATEHNTGMVLTFALSYGSRSEIIEAVKSAANDLQSGKINPAQLDEKYFSQKLSTVYMPDPDLIIRTSGEARLSNFLLWQAAYSEFYFEKELWPNFQEELFMAALNWFDSRERRFGKTSKQVQQETYI